MTQGSVLDPTDIRVFPGSSHPELAAEIAQLLGVPLDTAEVSRFSNDCLYVQLGATARSRAVFIVQTLTPPVSDHLLELLMMIDAARGAAAREVHAIIPYYSFARSDKKDAPRISITARLVADLIETAGATHVMTMMLHSPQVHGFFHLPIDPLTARGLLEAQFHGRDLDGTIVVAPDIGAAKSAARFAAGLRLPTIAADKERLSDTEVRVNPLIRRQVEGYRRAIVYDDEIATGGSIVTLCQFLVEAGIEQISAVCTHGVFTGQAAERLRSVPEITEIITTNTVPIPDETRALLPNLTVLSVAGVFAEAIRRNYNRESISSLFVFGEDEK